MTIITKFNVADGVLYNKDKWIVTGIAIKINEMDNKVIISYAIKNQTNKKKTTLVYERDLSLI